MSSFMTIDNKASRKNFLLLIFLLLLLQVHFISMSMAETDEIFTENDDNSSPSMPTKERSLIIGVPGKAPIENFVKITSNKDSSHKDFDGFCIRVFQEVVRTLDELKSYRLHVEFREFNGTYDELVDSLANNTYDGIVGDLTITAKRWNKVEFTEPFTESGLVTVVPVRQEDKGWIFLKPFKLDLWLATGGILLYTMFIVWFMEHRSNPEFSGSWRDQLGNSLWFAFSSLFMAHREKIQSNYTRVVVVVWLFVGLLLTQSFTANLSAMFTVPRLISIDGNSLEMSNVKVGVDNNTLLKDFLETLPYKPEHVVNLESEEDYLEAFKQGKIKAAIMEIPYAKVFVNNNCNKYTITGSSYRFGGFGFAFQKGSLLASNVSEAILTMSENGDLKKLEKEWLIPSSDCSSDPPYENVDGLSLRDFKGLFFFSVGVSTISFLLLATQRLWNYLHQTDQGSMDGSIWGRIKKFARYWSNQEPIPLNLTAIRVVIEEPRIENTNNITGNNYSLALIQHQRK